MIYVVHIVKEIKPFSCDLMDCFIKKKENGEIFFYLVDLKNYNLLHILVISFL